MAAPAVTILLADTSLWHRRSHTAVVQAWEREVTADRVATTPPVRLEVLYSARSAADYFEIASELDGLLQVPCGEAVWARALEVQGLLARQRPLHHRSVSIPDLVIAAAAELGGATVWHYDEDYERIAKVTGQAVEWVVPRASL